MAQHWRRILPVAPPPSPTQSPEVRLLQALAEADNLNQRWPDHFASAILREEARLAGDFIAPELLANADPRLRAAIAQPNGLDLILGWWEVKGRDDLIFHESELSHLTEQEARAWWLHIEKFSYREIAEFMDGKRRRTRQFGVSVEAVHKHLGRGAEKLRALLGVAA